jgi:hypothetical protein
MSFELMEANEIGCREGAIVASTYFGMSALKMGLVKRDWLVGRAAWKGCCWKWRIAGNCDINGKCLARISRGRAETKYNITRAMQHQIESWNVKTHDWDSTQRNHPSPSLL